MRRIVLLIPFFAIIVSCHKTKTTETSTIRIDVSKAIESKVSSLFKDVDFIPLETTDRGLAGLHVTRIECFEDRIYLLNRMSSHSNILCFNKEDGRFLFVIDRIGQGPGEYSYLNDFLIDIDKRNVVLLSENGRYLFLDMDGRYLFEKKSTNTYFSRQIEYLNDSTYLAYHDSSLPPEGYNLLYLDSKTLSIRSKSNSIQYYLQNTGCRPFSISMERILFYNANDSIYDIKKRAPLYYVDLGRKHEISKSQLNTLKASNEDMVTEAFKLFQKHEFFLVYSLFENRQWLAINIYNNAGENNEPLPSSFFLLFDKENQRLYDSRTLTFDILNLPPIEDVSIIGKTDNELYILIRKNFSMADLQKMEKGSSLSKEKINKILNRTSEDNPIIICLKTLLTD